MICARLAMSWQTLESLLAAGSFCVTLWLDLSLRPCEGWALAVLFSEQPLESCLNDPPTVECKVGLFLLDLRVGGPVPPLPPRKGMDHTAPSLPHGTPGHIWVNFWDYFATNQDFLLTLTCCCYGQVLQ